MDRLSYFSDQVGNNCPYDLKTVPGGPFNEDAEMYPNNYLNNYAFYDGLLLRSDDFGNFNYGVAGKAFGLSDFILESAAGANQLKNYIMRGSPIGGPSVYFDDPKDNYMVRLGIQYFNNTFQKK